MRRTAIAAACVAALVVAISIAAVMKLSGNISRFDIGAGSGSRPENSGGPKGPLNILVIGSDTREGLGTDEYGTDTVEGGAHSVTNLVVHISADRESAFVVSIPRDSMTMAPKDCADPASTVTNGEMRQWNYNYNLGGPACTVKTLEGLTGVYLDHVVVIDFSGFQRMVDALGGVWFNIPEDIADDDAVHRHRGFHVLFDGVDCKHLVFGFDEGEIILHLRLPRIIRGELVPRRGLALGVELD